VKHSDAKVPFVIKVVDTDEINAFALPGGYFYVNKGLILEAENESELAGVMAHEIAHVTARHATERMTKAQLLQFGALPCCSSAATGRRWRCRTAWVWGSPWLSWHHPKVRVGGGSARNPVRLEHRVRPGGVHHVLRETAGQGKEQAGSMASFWRTHPALENRIELVQTEIAALPPRTSTWLRLRSLTG